MVAWENAGFIVAMIYGKKKEKKRKEKGKGSHQWNQGRYQSPGITPYRPEAGIQPPTSGFESTLAGRSQW
jgi:hypothetical protein